FGRQMAVLHRNGGSLPRGRPSPSMNRNQSSPIAYDGEAGARDIGLGHEAAAALGLLLGFVLCYWQTLATLVEQWSSNDVYAHGFLIPMISGYLVWTRR